MPSLLSTNDDFVEVAARGFEKNNTQSEKLMRDLDKINYRLDKFGNSFKPLFKGNQQVPSEQDNQLAQKTLDLILDYIGKAGLAKRLADVIKEQESVDITQSNYAGWAALKWKLKETTEQKETLNQFAKNLNDTDFQTRLAPFFNQQVKDKDQIDALLKNMSEIVNAKFNTIEHLIRQREYMEKMPEDVKTVFNYIKNRKPDDKKLATIVKTIPIVKISPILQLLGADNKKLGAPLCNSEELKHARNEIYQANSSSKLLKLKAAGRTVLAVITSLIPVLGKYTRTWAEKANHRTLLEEREIDTKDYDDLKFYRGEKSKIRANNVASLFNQNGELKASKEFHPYDLDKGSMQYNKLKVKLRMLREQAHRFDDWKKSQKQDKKHPKLSDTLQLIFAINKSKGRSQEQINQETQELNNEMKRINP